MNTEESSSQHSGLDAAQTNKNSCQELVLNMFKLDQTNQSQLSRHIPANQSEARPVTVQTVLEPTLLCMYFYLHLDDCINQFKTDVCNFHTGFFIAANHHSRQKLRIMKELHFTCWIS